MVNTDYQSSLLQRKKEYNGKDKLHGGSSVTEKPPELAFQDALTRNEEDILSGTLEDIYDRTMTDSFEQDKKEEVRDSLKGLEIQTYDLTSHIITLKYLIKNTRHYPTQKTKFFGFFYRFLVKESGKNKQETACAIKAPVIFLENLKCNILNGTSSLAVDDSEELVSNVISIECYDYEKLLFSINIAIPFTSCFRGNYREIMVKVTDVNFQSNYLTPISLQRYQGNHKGFVEVKIHHLGVFSVLSCLKKETFTVPKVGLLQKLSVDSRISFCYHPEAFSSPAPMQLKIQPIERSMVSALKARHDMYHSVISTSALVHVQHPSPNLLTAQSLLLYSVLQTQKKKGKEMTEHARAITYSFGRTIFYNLSDILKLLGHGNKEEGWKVFYDVIVQNAQNGLEEGCFGSPEPIQQFPLREGEQIHFRFRGNISASENGEDFGKVYRLIFHSQIKPRLELQIKEVDEFGNYSSPHYKGTALFYKITREMITKKWEQNLPNGEYQHQSPLCKLALTLPKVGFSLDIRDISLFPLPLKGSCILQLVRLKCPDNLTHQFYELLCWWKKTLPRSADKRLLSVYILSRYLQKSGRSDLSEELHLKWQNKSTQCFYIS
uniref:Uncharacterized protein n=1 Tax=Corvus moneduloides TaxID=1196302 RepID=A0A8C3E4N9_CORMO